MPSICLKVIKFKRGKNNYHASVTFPKSCITTPWTSTTFSIVALQKKHSLPFKRWCAMQTLKKKHRQEYLQLGNKVTYDNDIKSF